MAGEDQRTLIKVCPSVTLSTTNPTAQSMFATLVFQQQREDGTCQVKRCNFLLYFLRKIKLGLREECRLRVFENKVLGRIFGSRRGEVTGEWRKLHNKELYHLYSSPNIIWMIKSRRLRWTGHVACMGERRGACRVLVGKPERRRPLGRPRRTWKDNIKMEIWEVGWGNGKDLSGSV